MNIPIWRYLILFLTVLMLVSCKSIGPGRLAVDREAYNNIVKQTGQEELLVNIVRGRYLEILQDIQITSLTASYNLNKALSANVNAVTRPGPVNLSTNVSPSVSYSDSPTITYMPLSDAEFAKSLMTPITMTNFLLLAHAGEYDHIILMELLFQRLNEVSCSIVVRNGVGHETTEFRKFYDAIRALSYLSRHHQLEKTIPVMYDKNFGIMVEFKRNCEKSPRALLLKKLLGVAPNSKNIIFLEHTIVEDIKKDGNLLALNIKTPDAHNIVYVSFRSVLSAMHWLGFGVQIPRQDIAAHRTRELIQPDGRLYHWRRIMRDVFTVYVSDVKPRNDVAVRVFTHGHWFYIKASDSASKETLNAMALLVTLTSAVANSSNNAPVLTIPVKKQ